MRQQRRLEQLENAAFLALVELQQVQWSGVDAKGHVACADCAHRPPYHVRGCEMKQMIRLLRRLLGQHTNAW